MNKRRIIIVGGHALACLSLDYLVENSKNVVLCITRLDDTGEDSIFPSLLAKARNYNIPTLQPKRLNDSDVLSVVKDFHPDIVLSLENNMVFGEEWTSYMEERLGIVNAHLSPLPKYGGYWPEMWAIWNNEKEFAVTIHYVNKGIDDGPIISQVSFELEALETRKSLYEKSILYCFDMLKENIDFVLEKKVPGKKQDKMLRTYFPKSLPNDGFLDLSWDADTSSRFIRSISFPGFVGPKIKIGENIITLLAEDLPFFKPVKIN